MKTKILIPLAGLALFCACKGPGSSSQSSDNVSDSAKKETINGADTAAVVRHTQKPQTDVVQPKLVKTASLKFAVKDVQRTSGKIADLTTGCGGTVMYHTINNAIKDSTTIQKTDDSLLKITVADIAGDMTVKVPAAKVEPFIEQVAQLGATLGSLKFEVNDKTFDYLSTRLKLDNARSRAETGGNGSAGLNDPDKMLAYKNDMVDRRMNNLRTDDSVKNAVIGLHFYANNVVHKEAVANPDLSAYRAPLAGRLGNSFKTGWTVFSDIMVGLADFWVLIPLGLAAWGVVRYINKRKKVAEVVKR